MPTDRKTVEIEMRISVPRALAAAALLAALLALPERAPAVAPQAPQTLAAAEAAGLDLTPYAGKVVYLDFWASWCPPCRSSFPWMSDLEQRLGRRGLVVVTVNVDTDAAAADRFLATRGDSLTVIRDPQGELAEAWHLEGMPYSFVYGRDGHLRSAHLGFAQGDEERIEAEIEKLLAEKAGDDGSGKNSAEESSDDDASR